MAHRLQGVNEGRQQLFPIPQQDHIEKRRQRFRVGGQDRPPSEHDRVVVCALFTPDRDALAFEQIQQHGTIQFPAQGQSEQITPAMRWIPLIGEQPAHIQIGPAGQGGPDDLVPQAGDPHGVGAGEGQHRAQGIRLRNGRIKQQRFLIQGSSLELGLALVGAGGGGGVKARRRIDPPQA